LQPDYAEQDFEKLADTNSPHLGKLLGKLLKKKYPYLHPNIKEITFSFDDLLHWFLWPNFIKLYGEVNCLGFLLSQVLQFGLKLLQGVNQN